MGGTPHVKPRFKSGLKQRHLIAIASCRISYQFVVHVQVPDELRLDVHLHPENPSM